MRLSSKSTKCGPSSVHSTFAEVAVAVQAQRVDVAGTRPRAVRRRVPYRWFLPGREKIRRYGLMPISQRGSAVFAEARDVEDRTLPKRVQGDRWHGCDRGSGPSIRGSPDRRVPARGRRAGKDGKSEAAVVRQCRCHRRIPATVPPGFQPPVSSARNACFEDGCIFQRPGREFRDHWGLPPCPPDRRGFIAVQYQQAAIRFQPAASSASRDAIGVSAV